MKLKSGLKGGKSSLRQHKNMKTFTNQSEKKRKHQDKDEMIDVDIEMEKVISVGGKSHNDLNILSNGNKKNGVMKRHRDELQGLEEADPEFYQYLQQNDAGLLEFGQEEEGNGDDGDEDDHFDFETNDLDNFVDSDEEWEQDSNIKSNLTIKDKGKKKNKITVMKKSKDYDTNEVTEDQVKHLMNNAMEGSLTALKKLLGIFRAACIPLNSKRKKMKKNEKEDQEEEEEEITFAINTPDLYEYIMTHVIDFTYRAFYHFLDITDITKVDSKYLETHPKWKSVQILILSYFKSVLYTLSSLAESVNQGQVSVLLLSSLEHYIPLVGPLPRLCKNLLKNLLLFWSKDLLPSEDSYNMRGHSFLRIRQMVMKLPGAIPEECLRSIYLSYARTCKTFTETSFSNVIFMSQSIVELYSIDPAMAYQQGFLHIRQLALHVRTAILKKTSDSIHQITSWQFLNCIRLWTRVICSMPSNEEMGALAFPLSQIMFGILSMASTMYYVPLRFHIVTCLHQLTASCHIYIPVTLKVLEILENPELVSKSTPSSEIPPNFTYLTKLPSDSIGKSVVRDTIVIQTILLLRHDVELYRYHVAFPEYSYLISRKLRQFSKKCKVSKWRDLIKPLLGRIDSFVQNVKDGRLVLGLPVSQITEFEALLPKNSPDVKIRLMKLLSSNSSSSSSGTGVNVNINALTTVTETNLMVAKSKSATMTKSSSNNNVKVISKVSNINSNDSLNIPDSNRTMKIKTKKAKVMDDGMEQSLSSKVSKDMPDKVSALDWLDEDE